MPTTLYDEDVALWAEQQGRLLREAARRGSNEPIEASQAVIHHNGRYTLAEVLEHNPPGL